MSSTTQTKHGQSKRKLPPIVKPPVVKSKIPMAKIRQAVRAMLALQDRKAR